MKYQMDQETVSRLDRNFTFKSPQGDQVQRIQGLCQAARNFAAMIQGNCPHSLERALAFQKLEEVISLAVSSIVRNE